MKAPAYFALVLLSVLSLILVLVLIFESRHVNALQRQLQATQQALSAGVLGPQAQQISGRVIQDMGDAARTNAPLRALLERYGYRIAAATNAVSIAAPAGGETVNEEAQP